jgi:hypothetical protein
MSRATRNRYSSEDCGCCADGVSILRRQADSQARQVRVPRCAELCSTCISDSHMHPSSVWCTDQEMYSIELNASGSHDHPHPPPARAPPSAIRQFQARVSQSPGTLPKSLIVGTRHAPSVGKIHPKLSNLDYAGYLRRWALAETKHPNSLAGLKAWMDESDSQRAFVRGSSINADKGFISVAQDWMRAALDGNRSPISTDAVEGLISSPENSSLLCSVGFSNVLQRVVPWAITIILGKTTEHYQAHFSLLFAAMNLEVNEEGLVDWDGNVADFSLAQAKAFTETLAEYIRSKRPDIVPSKASDNAKLYLVVSASMSQIHSSTTLNSCSNRCRAAKSTSKGPLSESASCRVSFLQS